MDTWSRSANSRLLFAVNAMLNLSNMRVDNRFGGMRDWAIFRGDIRDAS